MVVNKLWRGGLATCLLELSTFRVQPWGNGMGSRPVTQVDLFPLELAFGRKDGLWLY